MELKYTNKMVAKIVFKLIEMDGGEEIVATHTNAATHDGAEVNTRWRSRG
jgi:hypothetical protein